MAIYRVVLTIHTPNVIKNSMAMADIAETYGHEPVRANEQRAVWQDAARAALEEWIERVSERDGDGKDDTEAAEGPGM